jgi:uncharacterized protein YjaG (DUF416 family)
MSDLTFDLDRLTKELSGLPPRRRVAFAASCCERLLPNYAAFARDANWGSPSVLREALDQVWAVAGGDNPNPERIRELRTATDRVMPDTESFSSDYTSSALDAGVAVLQALECCIDGDPATSAQAASSARDTVDMYIQTRDGLQYGAVDFETRIRCDSLMVKELEKQRADVQLLASSPFSDKEIATILRSSSETKSNIGLA